MRIFQLGAIEATDLDELAFQFWLKGKCPATMPAFCWAFGGDCFAAAVVEEPFRFRFAVVLGLWAMGSRFKQFCGSGRLR